MRRAQAQNGEEQRTMEAVERLRVTHAHRADGVAVVRLGKRSDARPLRLAGELPVLDGDFKRRLDRRGAVVGVEDALQAGRGDGYQLLRQLDAGNMGETQKRRLRDTVELRLDGVVQLAPAMAVDVAPERRDAVEIS